MAQNTDGLSVCVCVCGFDTSYKQTQRLSPEACLSVCVPVDMLFCVRAQQNVLPACVFSVSFDPVLQWWQYSNKECFISASESVCVLYNDSQWC